MHCSDKHWYRLRVQFFLRYFAILWKLDASLNLAERSNTEPFWNLETGCTQHKRSGISGFPVCFAASATAGRAALFLPSYIVYSTFPSLTIQYHVSVVWMSACPNGEFKSGKDMVSNTAQLEAWSLSSTTANVSMSLTLLDWTMHARSDWFRFPQSSCLGTLDLVDLLVLQSQRWTSSAKFACVFLYSSHALQWVVRFLLVDVSSLLQQLFAMIVLAAFCCCPLLMMVDTCSRYPTHSNFSRCVSCTASNTVSLLLHSLMHTTLQVDQLVPPLVVGVSSSMMPYLVHRHCAQHRPTFFAAP
jgi:hypothetical protein